MDNYNPVPLFPPPFRNKTIRKEDLLIMQMPNSKLSQLCSFEDNASAFITHFLMLFLLWWKNDVILKGKTSSADNSLFLGVPALGTWEKLWWKYSSFSSSLPTPNLTKFSFSFSDATTPLCNCSHRQHVNAWEWVCAKNIYLKNKWPAFKV